MTKEEFEKFIEQQKDAGLSEEEIAIVFGKMFQDDKLNREQFEACLNAIGFELSDDYKAMDDDELKKNVVQKKEGDEDLEDKKVDDGQQPPKAPEGGAAKDEEPKKDDKDDSKDEPEEDEAEEEDEESQAMKLFGLKK